MFAFLAFIGSAFLSTVFHYPVFTISWFVIMILFVLALTGESSEIAILAFVSFAYVPLGLIAFLSNQTSKIPNTSELSPFAWLLIIFVVIELILAISWLYKDQ